MRTLTYNVSRQKITSVGDHSGLVLGTKGYLEAQFKFDEEWKDCVKVATFQYENTDFSALLENDKCEIPFEALKGSFFTVRVEGRRQNYRILTNRVTERQGG